MGSIFKAYDIRGIYGEQLTDELAFKIGRAFVTFLKCKKVVIGRDMRPHSQPLFDQLVKGITLSGADVLDIGVCSTPMCYYAIGISGADAGIMITASHNPGEYNGFKLSREDALPISGDTGIKDIEKIVNDEDFLPESSFKGSVTQLDIIADYVNHVRKLVDIKEPIRIAADMANSMGIYESRALSGVLDMDALFDTLDGTFPNHEANPLKRETLDALIEKVKSGKYDFGIAFDGDADRVGFVDEKGNPIPMDIITALIAKDLLEKEKGVIFYDLRSSWAVKEVIESSGGTAMMSRVGHAFIKKQMRENNAIFAGELSGHYYFRDNFFTESSSMAVICVANIVSKSGKTLSELIKPIKKYFASGEINSKVEDKNKVFDAIKEEFSDGRIIELDGVSVEYDDWWFNIRASNTEPLIRLNLEAKSLDLMEEKRDKVLAVINS